MIVAACGIGFASVSNDVEKLDKIRTFAEKVGIAFQMRDDLFDFGNENTGKPTGIDIKEKKLTLPLIYALNNAEKSERSKIIYIIKNQNTNKKKVQEVIDFVWKSGGIEYTQNAMMQYQKEAFDILHEFPESEARNSLEQLVRFTTERRK